MSIPHGTMPASEASSYYHLYDVDLAGRACAGTACFVARARDPERYDRAIRGAPRVYCFGKCHAAPATAETSERPRVTVATAEPIVLRRIVDGTSCRAPVDYRALEAALVAGPARVLDEVDRSELRGRGGAAYPTGRKMRAVARAADGAPRFVVANADEGDPGAFGDRVLLEEDPNAVLEGLAIAALAAGAGQGFVYLRREYPAARTALERAIAEAHEAGVFGPDAFGPGSPFDVTIADGLGSYVCGEETAMLASIEGVRPFVRSRPPYPCDVGLFGRPTLVLNVETLATLPFVVTHGGAAHAAIGVPGSRGTKLVSLCSLFRRPGLYEVALGTTLSAIVDDLGGGLASGTLRGVIVGGPLAGALPPRCLDAPLAFEPLRALGASVGHGGIVAFDESTSARALLEHVFAFGAYESCGRCTPCRLGAAEVEAMAAGTSAWSMERFEALTSALVRTSLCGHGGGLGELAASLLRYYREELESCFA